MARNKKSRFRKWVTKLFKKSVKMQAKIAARSPAAPPPPGVDTTPAGVLARLKELFPIILTSDAARQQSWKLLADKMSQAYAKQTTVFCVTVNPDILTNRDAIAEKFPCQVCSPTEALNSGGFDSIMMQ